MLLAPWPWCRYLGVMEQASRREAVEEGVGRAPPPGPLLSAPSAAVVQSAVFHVMGRHEGWLPPKGEAHVASRQRLVDLLAEGIDPSSTAHRNRAG